MKSERYISSIIFGEANCGKTGYLIKFKSKNKEFKLKYFDILEELGNLEDKTKVILFLPKSYLEYLHTLIKKESSSEFDAFILDNLDIVLNRWGDPNTEEFIKKVQLLDKTFCPKPIIFCLQTNKTLEHLNQVENNSSIPKLLNYTELETI